MEEAKDMASFLVELVDTLVLYLACSHCPWCITEKKDCICGLQRRRPNNSDLHALGSNNEQQES